MKLNYSPVQYDREAHTYTLNGVRLQGITGLIQRQLFPDEYRNIPEDVLKKAACKGTLVHNNCQYYDEFGAMPEKLDSIVLELMENGYTPMEAVLKAEYVRDMVTRYSMLRDLNNLKHIVSEYVVSDNEHFASPIDVVYEESENSVILGDIKTVSKVSDEKVAWQLSIYAKWFEELNPHIKVSKLIVIWLPEAKYGEPKIAELQRKSNEDVQRLLDCEISGTQYLEGKAGKCTDLTPTGNNLPAELEFMKQYVIDTLLDYKEAEARKKEMLAKVQEAMQTFKIKSWTTDTFTFTQTKDSERRTFDLDKLKIAYPDINFDDDKFYKVTKVKGGITAKLK